MECYKQMNGHNYLNGKFLHIFASYLKETKKNVFAVQSSPLGLLFIGTDSAQRDEDEFFPCEPLLLHTLNISNNITTTIMMRTAITIV